MRAFILMFLFVSLLASCSLSFNPPPSATVTAAALSATPLPITSTPSVTATTTVRPTIWYTPSPRPPLPVFVTPDAVHLQRWKEYEEALARTLMRATPPERKVLCEWILLGRSEEAIYVWALCAEHEQNGIYPYPGVSEPAAIYIGPEGEVVGVKVPEPGGPFVRDIFPEDVQEKIFRAHNRGWLDVSQLKAHLIYRFEHPDVPPWWSFRPLQPRERRR